MLTLRFTTKVVVGCQSKVTHAQSHQKTSSKDCRAAKTVEQQRLSSSKDCRAAKTVEQQRLSSSKD